MATNIADITDATNTNAGAAKPAAAAPKTAAAHREALLDEALLETFPASDPISPAYEARLEARRAAQDEDAARVRRIGMAVLGGMAAVALAAWLVRSLTRTAR